MFNGLKDKVKEKLSTVFNQKSLAMVKTGMSGAGLGLQLGGLAVIAAAVFAVPGVVAAAPALLAGAAVVGGIATAGQAFKAFKA